MFRFYVEFCTERRYFKSLLNLLVRLDIASFSFFGGKGDSGDAALGPATSCRDLMDLKPPQARQSPAVGTPPDGDPVRHSAVT